jgi:subtilisin family serine protease
MRRCLWAVSVIALSMTVLNAGSGGQDIIVELRHGDSIEKVNRDFAGKTLRQVRNRPLYLIHVDDSDDKILKKLRKELSVVAAELNPKIRLDSTVPLNVGADLGQDMAALLDGKTLTTFNGTTVLKAYVDQPALNVPAVDRVRAISTGAGTRVGYIDTGIDPDHPALRPWVEPGVDLVANSSTSEFDGLSQDMAALLDQDMAALLDQDMAVLLDKRLLFVLNQSLASILTGTGQADTAFPSAWGHGTLVAGIIHAVAPDARIVPIKAFDASGYTTMFTLVEAVYSAMDQNVDVLNMSFSTSEDSSLFSKAIAEAKGSGIAIVASVGNNASGERYIYPASYSAVYGVAATDFNDRLAAFSNYGTSVAVAAPGAFVVSTVPGGRYAAAWGTSFSAPIVSGGIALLASARGYGHSDSMVVLNNADFIDNLNPGFEKKLGKGRINLYRALTK